MKRNNLYKNVIKQNGIIVCLIIFWHISFCQISFRRTIIRGGTGAIVDKLVAVQDTFRLMQLVLPDVFVDTLQVKGDDYLITHYHLVSSELNKRMISESKEEIFNDSSNQYSRLIFEGPDNYKFNVPTIPLTHIVYLKKSRLIIGLSKIVASPYHIVIYSTSGKLLCKRTLKNLELRLDKKELKNLLKAYPGLTRCLAQNIIVKENDNYNIEISTCLLNIIGRESLLKMNRIVSSPYFPLMSTSFDSRLYSKYYYSFSDSDPLYDLIMVGSVPYLLILNSEDGSKVNIPLISIPLLDISSPVIRNF